MSRRPLAVAGIVLGISLLFPTRGPTAPPLDTCQDAIACGKALFKAGETEAAVAACDSALSLAGASGLSCRGEALYRIGVARDHRGELAAAEGPLGQAEALARRARGRAPSRGDLEPSRPDGAPARALRRSGALLPAE